jgi:hypothetical protein
MWILMPDSYLGGSIRLTEAVRPPCGDVITMRREPKTAFEELPLFAGNGTPGE